jgi:hypothetical protein
LDVAIETMRCAGPANAIDLPSPSVSLIGSGAAVAVGVGGSDGAVVGALVEATIGSAVGAGVAAGRGVAAGAHALNANTINSSSVKRLRDIVSFLLDMKHPARPCGTA